MWSEAHRQFCAYPSGRVSGLCVKRAFSLVLWVSWYSPVADVRRLSQQLQTKENPSNFTDDRQRRGALSHAASFACMEVRVGGARQWASSRALYDLPPPASLHGLHISPLRHSMRFSFPSNRSTNPLPPPPPLIFEVKILAIIALPPPFSSLSQLFSRSGGEITLTGQF